MGQTDDASVHSGVPLDGWGAGSAQCNGVLLAARMIDEREPESS